MVRISNVCPRIISPFFPYSNASYSNVSKLYPYSMLYRFVPNKRLLIDVWIIFHYYKWWKGLIFWNFFDILALVRVWGKLWPYCWYFYLIFICWMKIRLELANIIITTNLIKLDCLFINWRKILLGLKVKPKYFKEQRSSSSFLQFVSSMKATKIFTVNLTLTT